MNERLRCAIRLFFFSMLIPLIGLIIIFINTQYDTNSDTHNLINIINISGIGYFYILFILAHAFGITSMVMFAAVVDRHMLEILGFWKVVLIALIGPLFSTFLGSQTPEQLGSIWFPSLIQNFLLFAFLPTVIPIALKEFMRRKHSASRCYCAVVTLIALFHIFL